MCNICSNRHYFVDLYELFFRALRLKKFTDNIKDAEKFRRQFVFGTYVNRCPTCPRRALPRAGQVPFRGRSSSPVSADITLPKMTFSFKPYKGRACFCTPFRQARGRPPQKNAADRKLSAAQVCPQQSSVAHAATSKCTVKIGVCGIFLIFPHPIASFAHKSHAAKQICNP